MKNLRKLHSVLYTSFLAVTAITTSPFVLADKGHAGNGRACSELPDHDMLQTALKMAVSASDAFGNPTGGSGTSNGGLDFNMWATLVARDGTVCAVARTGDEPGDQWPGSRVISAQKANTANAFSLPVLALSTANLFEPTQPGHSLWELTQSNPVDPSAAYKGKASKYGSKNDPLVGERVGGVNAFGGGLGAYKPSGLVGALGVSGDTSCADHAIAWKVRYYLNLDHLPAGVNSGTDNLISAGTAEPDGYDASVAFGHPVCSDATKTVIDDLPTSFPVGSNAPAP